MIVVGVGVIVVAVAVAVAAVAVVIVSSVAIFCVDNVFTGKRFDQSGVLFFNHHC